MEAVPPGLLPGGKAVLVDGALILRLLAAAETAAASGVHAIPHLRQLLYGIVELDVLLNEPILQRELMQIVVGMGAYRLSIYRVCPAAVALDDEHVGIMGLEHLDIRPLPVRVLLRVRSVQHFLEGHIGITHGVLCEGEVIGNTRNHVIRVQKIQIWTETLHKAADGLVVLLPESELVVGIEFDVRHPVRDFIGVQPRLLLRGGIDRLTAAGCLPGGKSASGKDQAQD